jgi:hypothetical protein
MQKLLSDHRLLAVLVVSVGLTAASSAHALPPEWEEEYGNDTLFTHDFQFAGEFASLPRVTVIGRRDLGDRVQRFQLC